MPIDKQTKLQIEEMRAAQETASVVSSFFFFIFFVAGFIFLLTIFLK